MGTNYYYFPSEDDKDLGSIESIHIGKASAGWSFSFHGYESTSERSLGDSDGILYRYNEVSLSIKSKKDWVEFFSNHIGSIKDEYGRILSIEEFLKVTSDHSPNSEYRGKKLSILSISDIRIHDSEGYSIAFYNFS